MRRAVMRRLLSRDAKSAGARPWLCVVDSVFPQRELDELGKEVRHQLVWQAHRPMASTLATRNTRHRARRKASPAPHRSGDGLRVELNAGLRRGALSAYARDVDASVPRPIASLTLDRRRDDGSCQEGFADAAKHVVPGLEPSTRSLDWIRWHGGVSSAEQSIVAASCLQCRGNHGRPLLLARTLCYA